MKCEYTLHGHRERQGRGSMATRPIRRFAGAILLAAFCVFAGCQAIPPRLPSAIPGVTLDTIAGIQSDPTQTPAGRMAIVRSLFGLNNDDAGNRLANFLLSLQIPARRPPGTVPQTQ